MSHSLLIGDVFHKRYIKKEHSFKYKFFMLDFNVSKIKTLENRIFKINKFSLFSFYTKDHFGDSKDFKLNVDEIIKKYKISGYDEIRFITLPSVLGFVFNPISTLLFLKDKKPIFFIAEVHNYNGGRVLYPVDIDKEEVKKEMYVSPFFETNGKYKFKLEYDKLKMSLKIKYLQNEELSLIANFSSSRYEYKEVKLFKLFFTHFLITFSVVLKTIYQSLKLYFKGLEIYKPKEQDKIKRN